MNIYILYLITGALGGFLGGFLGLGGGIIFVPFLFVVTLIIVVTVFVVGNDICIDTIIIYHESIYAVRRRKKVYMRSGIYAVRRKIVGYIFGVISF